MFIMINIPLWVNECCFEINSKISHMASFFLLQANCRGQVRRGFDVPVEKFHMKYNFLPFGTVISSYVPCPDLLCAMPHSLLPEKQPRRAIFLRSAFLVSLSHAFCECGRLKQKMLRCRLNYFSGKLSTGNNTPKLTPLIIKSSFSLHSRCTKQPEVFSSNIQNFLLFSFAF